MFVSQTTLGSSEDNAGGTMEQRKLEQQLPTLKCLTSKILFNTKLRNSLVSVNPKLTTKVLQMPARFNETENVHDRELYLYLKAFAAKKIKAICNSKTWVQWHLMQLLL